MNGEHPNSPASMSTDQRVCGGCEHKIPWDWVFCAWCGFENDAPDPQTKARLKAIAPDLLALAKKYASECADCGGTGRIVTRSGGSGWGDGGPDVHEEVERCGECEDIRAVIAKAEGRS